MASQETTSVTSKTIQQICTGLDLSRCKRQATVHDCLHNMLSNIRDMRYFYIAIAIVISWFLLPIKVHIMSIIVTLSMAQLHYQLPAKPISEQSAEALHALVIIAIMYTLGLILFEVVDSVAGYGLFVGTFVYVHSSTYEPLQGEDAEQVKKTIEKGQSGLIGPLTFV